MVSQLTAVCWGTENYFLYLQLITRAETTALCSIDATHPCHEFAGREFKHCNEICQGIFLFGTQNNQFIEQLEDCRVQSFGWMLMGIMVMNAGYAPAYFLVHNAQVNMILYSLYDYKTCIAISNMQQNTHPTPQIPKTSNTQNKIKKNPPKSSCKQDVASLFYNRG